MCAQMGDHQSACACYTLLAALAVCRLNIETRTGSSRACYGAIKHALVRITYLLHRGGRRGGRHVVRDSIYRSYYAARVFCVQQHRLVGYWSRACLDRTTTRRNKTDTANTTRVKAIFASYF